MHTIHFFTGQNGFEICDPVKAGCKPAGADLFELHMFLVDIGNGRSEWCGILQNVKDGEKHYFRGWSGLVANLEGILTPVGQLELLGALGALDKAVYGEQYRLM